ncbi:ATP-dependent DNA ligase [candidate division WWE3 bacterium]|uniref:DNA ligase n=1 Tax=candidate division WWE3 bacterium TaxID=2053526 RepID=A0A7X9DL03_UNCKA|nr:ATP-dependent DNA ligase [candidate division WWE3 bacterium]
MKTSEFSQYLKQLEETSKRLEITAILAELLNKLDNEEIDKGVYLALGILKAPYDNPKFNIAEKMMIRILEQAYSVQGHLVDQKKINDLYNKAGDLGNVAFELAQENKTKSMPITNLHARLVELAEIEGTGSQELKVKKAAALLNELDPLSAKYVVRIILGITRLGFTELTLVAALAVVLGDKSMADGIESVYNTHPDIGLIAKALKSHGIKSLNSISLETGVPILSQKAQRLSGPEEAIEKMTSVWAEYKFDGTRVQLHFDKTKLKKSNTVIQEGLFSLDSAVNNYLINTYTRNLEETTHQFPDLVEAAQQQINAESVILDGEAIGYDRKTGAFLPFQETIQRKRKHGVKDTAQNIPLKYFVFDILYYNGKPTVNKPLKERRELLAKIIKPGDVILVDEHIETGDPDELQEYYDVAKQKGLEGLVVKKPDDPYQAGARSFSWVKLKKADQKLLDDSVDCVVLGYYAGRGVRSKFGIGGFLVGVIDPEKDVFRTVTKIGTGLTEEDWVFLKKLCDKYRTDKVPQNVLMDKMFMPDVIVMPKIVVEIGADEISISQTHTAGYALRFPRLLKFRKDKNPSEATTVDEIRRMYKAQKVDNSNLL